MTSAPKDSHQPGPVRVVGRLVLAFENREFTPIGADDGWWCYLSHKVEHDIQAQYGKPPEEIFGIWNSDNEVEVEGELSMEGNYGHMSVWRREIHIRKLRIIRLDGHAEH